MSSDKYSVDEKIGDFFFDDTVTNSNDFGIYLMLSEENKPDTSTGQQPM